jgi:hypothetical protein
MSHVMSMGTRDDLALTTRSDVKRLQRGGELGLSVPKLGLSLAKHGLGGGRF